MYYYSLNKNANMYQSISVKMLTFITLYFLYNGIIKIRNHSLCYYSNVKLLNNNNYNSKNNKNN